MSAEFTPLKSLAMRGYTAATLPLRKLIEVRRSWNRTSRVMIFFYHRVAKDPDDGWTTDPDIFRKQMRWLKRRYDMVSLAEAQRRVREGNSRPAVHITFDDGYADNCVDALPFLLAEKIPVTYFVSTSFIQSGEPFPHDVERGTPRAPNTRAQLAAMASAGIEVAAHTRTHVDFSTVTDEAQARDEILGSKQDLEAMTGKPVRFFAFPYGRRDTLTPLALQVAQEAGFDAVVSAYGGYNFPGEESYLLQRMHGDNDLVRFKNWATLDPRKIGIRSPALPTRINHWGGNTKGLSWR